MKISELIPQTIEVTVTTTIGLSAEGEPIVRQLPPFVLRILTMHEWWEIGQSVPEPAAPRDNKGKPLTDDLEYKQRRDNAENERAFRRLAAALDTPESGIEFETKTIADRAEELYAIAPSVFLALYGKLAEQVLGRSTRISANSFR